MNPILVEVYRNQVLESFHRGVVCVVDKNGNVVYSEGDIQQVCYPRSAMKLIQVMPLLELGGQEKFDFTLEEIAVMCGSHNAEPEHLSVVNSILQKIGLDKENLKCGPQYPTSKRDADELIRKSEKPHHIHNNCSGKHAGMLALCQLLGVDVEDYLNAQHPIQTLILQYVEEMYEYPKEKMIAALDGCSAPIYSIPVYNQALAFKNLVNTESYPPKRKATCNTIVKAMAVYPIDDGKMLPQYNVAQAFVEATGIFSEEALLSLETYKQADLNNFNKFVTGEIKVREGLFNGLKIN
ncbi:MAG: asparaginase [Bacteroidetes bacterium]|nr:asparaginase [Bacteroidota bacterium]